MNVKQAIFYLSFIISTLHFVAEIQVNYAKKDLTVITLHLIDRVLAQFFEHIDCYGILDRSQTIPLTFVLHNGFYTAISSLKPLNKLQGIEFTLKPLDFRHIWLS